MHFFTTIIRIVLSFAALAILSGCGSSPSLSEFSFPSHMELQKGDILAVGELSSEEGFFSFILTEPETLSGCEFQEGGGIVTAEMGEINISSESSELLDGILISSALKLLEEISYSEPVFMGEKDEELSFESENLKLCCDKSGTVSYIIRLSDRLEISFSS